MQNEKNLLKMPKNPSKKRTIEDLDNSESDMSTDNIVIEDETTKNASSKLQQLATVIEPSNKQIMEGIQSMFALLSSSHSKITNIEKKIATIDTKLSDHGSRIKKLEATTDTLRDDVDKNTATVNYFKQKEIDNKVLISGFQAVPDHQTVSKTILALYEMSDSPHSSYSYQRTITTKEGQKMTVGALVIEFCSKSDQIKFISRKKAKGPIMLKQLFHNGGDQKLKIFGILTEENVKIQKKVRSLLEDDLITEIKFKNCTFIIKITPTSLPLAVSTSDQAEALNINLRTKNLKNPDSIPNSSNSVK